MEPSSRPLYLVCTRKEVSNLLNCILCRKHVAARKGKNGNVAQSTLTSEFIGWRKTGMLQQYHLTTFHVTTWSGHLSSKITVTSKHTDSCLACNVILTDAHMPCTSIQANMQNTYHIKGSNMLAWFGEVEVWLGEVRGSVTSSGTYGITKTGTNVKTNACIKTSPKNFQLNPIKN